LTILKLDAVYTERTNAMQSSCINHSLVGCIQHTYHWNL